MEDTIGVDTCANDIAVIGMAANFAKAKNIYEYWNNLIVGRDLVSDCPETRKKDIDDYLDFCGIPEEKRKYRMASYLDHIDYFDYEFFHISPKEARLMDPYQRLLLQTLYNTIEDSGYGMEYFASKRVGIYTGFPTEYTSKVYQNILIETNPNLANDSFSGNLVAMFPARLAYFLDLHGPAYVIDTSCSSSLSAVHLACQGIRTNDCEMAIANGINLFTIPLLNEIVGAIGILSPDGRAKTFDDSCEGVGQGEGVGAILLKPLQKAIQDRDHIYAVIKSSAVNQDGKSIGITAPNAKAQEAVIMEGWERANIDPTTVSYIEAHGTATKLGDPTEIKGINQAFRHFTDATQFCGVGSVKSNIGHTLGAAGVASVIKVALALEQKKIPPSIHFQKPNRRISFETSSVYVNDRLQDWETNNIRRAGISSFGITGTNCHIVMEEAPNKIIDSTESGTQVFTVSANQIEVLKELLMEYQDYLKVNDLVNLSDLCYTANTGRKILKCRIAIVITSSLELLQKIERICDTWCDKTNKEQYEAEGIYFSSECMLEEDEEDEETNVDISKLETFDKNSIAKLFVTSKKIDWSKIYKTSQYNRISLPVYPFQKTRCWLTIPKVKQNIPTDQMYYQIKWLQKDVEHSRTSQWNKEESWLVLSNGDKVVQDMITQLRLLNLPVIEVCLGTEFKQSNGLFIIRNKQEDYERLLDLVKDKKITNIVHAVSRFGEDISEQECLDYGVYSLFRFAKALEAKVTNRITMFLLTKQTYSVTQKETYLQPINAAAIGFMKTLKWELQNIRCKCIDLDESTKVQDIIYEMQDVKDEFIVSYRMSRRYVERVDTLDLNTVESTKLQIVKGGVYVLVGGTGRIGRLIAKSLAKKENIHIVMIHRTPIPDHDSWNQIIADEKDTSLVRKLKELIEIEKCGSDLTFYQADIKDTKVLNDVICNIREKYQTINGIVQCAVDDTPLPINQLTEEMFRRAMDTKVTSTYGFSQLTRKDSLDFFVMFSSVMTLVGGVGSGSYMASNSYLEAFSQWRTKNELPSLVISWPEWLQIGLDERLMNQEETSIYKKIEKDVAVTCFEELLPRKMDRVIVGEIQKDSKIYEVIDYLPFQYDEHIANALKHKSTGADLIEEKEVPISLLGRKTEIYSELEKKIGSSICKVMGYEKLNIFANFFELGGDSILAVKISVDLEDKNISLSAPDILKYQTVEKMAEFVKQQG
ncbi:MAG: SDR family NAD(P)-dependent oxidoreductase [Clostridiales bacterium]|nr:SDR family NAD(P)-dependent oxidoreductase [Clostridiales bacterium]